MEGASYLESKGEFSDDEEEGEVSGCEKCWVAAA